MIPKTYLLLMFLAVFTLFSNVAAFSQGSFDVPTLALDMFKYDQYVPAIDVLEADEKNQEQNFNYWLYLGLAYQHSAQFNKSVKAYKKALEINPDAKNLQVRIQNLKKAISLADENRIKDLRTSKDKASWLFMEAQKNRNRKKEEKAFRIFIQAVEYDIELLGNDKGFISRGSVYYRLKVEENAEYAKLFYAIFKYFEGELNTSYSNIKSFSDSKTKKTPAILRMEKHYLRLISNAVKVDENMELAAAIEKKLKQEETKKAKMPANKKKKSEKTPDLAKMTKDSSGSRTTDIREVESEISKDSFSYRDDSSFLSKYAYEIAKIKVKEYFASDDFVVKKQLLWEMGSSHSQDPEVMDAVIDGLGHNNIDMLFNALDAIRKIGMPSADRAIPTLVHLIDSDRPSFRRLAVDSLCGLKARPEEVIPAIIARYNKEDNEQLMQFYVNSVKLYGDRGLKVVNKLLEDSPRVDRRPIAKFIQGFTGEKLEDIINR